MKVRRDITVCDVLLLISVLASKHVGLKVGLPVRVDAFAQVPGAGVGALVQPRVAIDHRLGPSVGADVDGRADGLQTGKQPRDSHMFFNAYISFYIKMVRIPLIS